MKIDYKEAKEALREWAVKYTGGCSIQADGWPCGTCFCALLGELGLDHSNLQYKEHNKPVDRINEVKYGGLSCKSERTNRRRS